VRTTMTGVASGSRFSAPTSGPRDMRVEVGMAKRISTRFTYANVMATLAVFIALGGGAYAVQGTASRGGVIRACVAKKTGSVRIVSSSRRCRKGAERAISWNRQGRSGLAGGPGSPGRDGANGLNGSPGAAGAPGATNVVVRTPGAGSATANCNAGEVAVGGGGDAAGGQLTLSRPNPASGSPTGWTVNNTGTMFIPQAYVVCAAP
jgi:hypothetical protein